MNIYLYAFSALIAFLGLCIGGLFSTLLQRKLHSFKLFLPFFQLLLLLATFLLLYTSFPFLIVTAVFLFTFIFIWAFWQHKDHNVLDYIIFAILFVMTSLHALTHYYMTIILFTFGIFTGGLFYSLHTKPQKLKGKKQLTENQHDIMHHKHAGKHHTHHVIMQKLFAKYFFFLPLTLTAYLVAQLLAFLF